MFKCRHFEVYLLLLSLRLLDFGSYYIYIYIYIYYVIHNNLHSGDTSLKHTTLLSNAVICWTIEIFETEFENENS